MSTDILWYIVWMNRGEPAVSAISLQNSLASLENTPLVSMAKNQSAASRVESVVKCLEYSISFVFTAVSANFSGIKVYYWCFCTNGDIVVTSTITTMSFPSLGMKATSARRSAHWVGVRISFFEWSVLGMSIISSARWINRFWWIVFPHVGFFIGSSDTKRAKARVSNSEDRHF